MKVIDLFYLVIHFVIIAFILRAIFYLFMAKKHMRWYSFVTRVVPLIAGLIGLLHQTNNPELLAERFPFIWLFMIGLSHYFYVSARDIAMAVNTIENTITDEVVTRKLQVLEDIEANDGEITHVCIDDLDKMLEINVTYATSNARDKALRKIPPHAYSDMCFVFYMMYNSVFGLQQHKKAHERIRIIEGQVLELHSGDVFKAGDIIDLPPGEPHGFKALSYVKGISDLKKIE